jgi:hypothetical protein
MLTIEAGRNAGMRLAGVHHPFYVVSEFRVISYLSLREGFFPAFALLLREPGRLNIKLPR